MKKIFLSLIAIIIFTSCDDNDTADVSSVTAYATFDYKPTVAIALGGTYDPNTVTATEDGNPLEVGISGAEDVDTNTVGAYKVIFSATNSDGYAATVTQTVVVHDPSIIGTDVSGRIRDKATPSRIGTITLVEGTTSIFFASDFGFAGTFPVYFQMNGDVISEISQSYINDVTSLDLSYNPVTKEFSVFINPVAFQYTFQYY